MRLPALTSSWALHVRFGLYVARKLRTAQLSDSMETVRSSTLNLRTLGRAWEDADFDAQEAMADRDASAEALDKLAREVRRKLLGRSDNAEKTEPYTLIVPDGLGWYTNAAVDERVSRYKQLRDRLNANLADTDDLRTDLVPRLETAIGTFENSKSALEDMRNAEDRARDDLESALSSWRELLDKTHGALISQFGKAEAEQFFPRTRSRSSSETGGE